MFQMEGFDLFDDDSDEETVIERKSQDFYQPIKRELFGFLDESPSNTSSQIRCNTEISKVMYSYSRREYQTAINQALGFLEDPQNVKCNKPLLSQFHDVICRSYTELGEYSVAKKHCQVVTATGGHGDSDCWMTAAVLEFLLGNVRAGFESLERSVLMRSSNPNIWLLYASALAHFHQNQSKQISSISEQLSQVGIDKRFNKNWAKIFKTEPSSPTGIYKDNAYFFITCAVNNAVSLAHSIYHQHNSKSYTEFSTAWSAETGKVLGAILSQSPESFKECLENNFNVIHFKNWDDVNFGEIDFVSSFLTCNLPKNT